MVTKSVTTALTLLAAGTLLSPASLLKADPVTWTLQNPLTFGLGGSLTGTFEYDASTNTWSNLNLSMTGDLIPAWVPANIRPSWLGTPSGPSQLVFGINESGPDDLYLNFANPLTSAGGSDTITSGLLADIREFEPGNGGAGDDSSTNSAAIEGTVTPEPGYWFAVLFGLVTLAALRIRGNRSAKMA